MDVKNTHSVTKTEISVFGRQALDAERRRSPSLADKVLIIMYQYTYESFLVNVNFCDHILMIMLDGRIQMFSLGCILVKCFLH